VSKLRLSRTLKGYFNFALNWTRCSRKKKRAFAVLVPVLPKLLSPNCAALPAGQRFFPNRRASYRARLSAAAQTPSVTLPWEASARVASSAAVAGHAMESSPPLPGFKCAVPLRKDCLLFRKSRNLPPAVDSRKEMSGDRIGGISWLEPQLSSLSLKMGQNAQNKPARAAETISSLLGPRFIPHAPCRA